MLDTKDLKNLQSMMESVMEKQLAKFGAEIFAEMDRRFAESETKFFAEMDRRFAESEAKIFSEMDRRFAESEAKIFSEMDRRFAESEAKMNKRFTEFEIKLTQMDKKLDRTKTNLLAEMDKRIAKSENLVLEEMERTRKILEIRIQTVQANLDEVRDYYRVTRLEQDNATLFLRMLTGLEKRVENLEQKSA